MWKHLKDYNCFMAKVGTNLSHMLYNIVLCMTEAKWLWILPAECVLNSYDSICRFCNLQWGGWDLFSYTFVLCYFSYLTGCGVLLLSLLSWKNVIFARRQTYCYCCLFFPVGPVLSLRRGTCVLCQGEVFLMANCGLKLVSSV